MSTIRFAGAQIPCTPYINKNIVTLKTAIDWAADNKVDYLVTPEASLSGYTVEFANNLECLQSALREIESYAAEKNVGLCLGTLWVEHGPPGTEHVSVKRNQIRYYAPDGTYLGATNKTVLSPLDLEIGIEHSNIHTGIILSYNDKVIPIAGIICADLYGYHGYNGGLPEEFFKMGATLLIHSTNAERGIDEFRDEIDNMWIESNLRRVSYMLLPVIVADNCYMMDGTEYHNQTSSQSGVTIKGEWVVKVPRTNTHYFYYDFNEDDLTQPIERYK